MDTLHSLSLFIALASGGLGTLMFVGGLVSRGFHRQRRRGVVRAGRLLGTIALLFGLLSASLHLTVGHSAGSESPMPVEQFVRHHKAYGIVLLFALLSLFGRLPERKERAAARRERA